jgi:hypothetical protein
MQRSGSRDAATSLGEASFRIRGNGNPAPVADVDCDDFPTHAAAQAWYLYYLPTYGDVAGLDANHDGKACETLR